MPSSEQEAIPEHCFLKVSIAGSPDPEPIVIQLFPKVVPQTCRNFVSLCNGSLQTSRKSPQPTYKGCEFHRIIPNFMVQTGDFERFDGTGGYSPIAPGKSFRDESFALSHSAEGIVSMANSGPHTSKSQFFITVKATPHLDKKHVVFGKVIKGMSVVHRMTTVELQNDRPVSMQKIVITDCGIGFDKEGREENIQDKQSKSKKKDKKRRRDRTDSDDSDDESERRNRGRKDKRHRKKKDKKQRRDYSDSDSDSTSRHEDDRRRRKHKEKSKRRERDRYPSSSSDDDDSDNHRSRKRSHKSKKRGK